MPLVKTVSVHYGRKINLGDYNSANVECTVWADVEPDEDLDAAMHALWSCAKENVKAQLVPLAKKNGAGSINIKETFLGLPIEARDEDLPGEGADIDPRDGSVFGDK
jgi:hypothetical protein